MSLTSRCFGILMLLALAGSATAQAQPKPPTPPEKNERAEYIRSHYTKYEYRIPMRDGVRLFTAVYVPKDATPPRRYPIMLMRHAVQRRALRRGSVPGGARARASAFAKEGYIFVVPGRARPVDVRRRVRQHAAAQPEARAAEGHRREHRHVRHDRLAGEERARTTTARSGMWGISYPGFYTSAGMIDAHPALKAVVAAGADHRLVRRRRLAPQRRVHPAARLQLLRELRQAAPEPTTTVPDRDASSTARPTATSSSSTWGR